MFTRKLWFTMLVVMLILAIAPVPGVRAASIIRVTPTGATSGACGSSWAAPCSMQRALSLAVSGDEIWVAAGVYKPTTGNDRSATFALKNGVALYGGFFGTETARGQRNWTSNVSTLSGEIGAAGNNDNSYHVVTADHVNTAAVLDGFTVTGGNANVSGTNEGMGGGIYNYYGSPTIQNMILSNNAASDRGGGMLNNHSSPALFRVTFSGNSSAGDGGGMGNMEESAPTLTNVTFSGNSAATGGGGGMFNDQCSPTLTNVTFSNNSAIGGNGGAMYNDLVSVPVLTNVTFDNNAALMNEGYNGGYGGAVYNYANVAPPSLTNVTFVGNRAVGYDAGHPTTGGAVYLVSGAVAITNTILWGNTPNQIYSDASVATLHTAVVQGGCPAGLTCTGIITADPLLGALGNYGGSVETVPLLPGSSALDTGRDASCPAADARGVTRPQGARCDIGAFESSRFTLAIIGGNNQSTLINTAFAQPLRVSVTANNAVEPINGGKVIFTPPASGASASLATSPATIAGGAASVNATANGIAGLYMVNATMAGGNTVGFSLRNLPPPTVRYVKPAATGAGSCANWANACVLQTALGQAVSSDEIWAAAGMYKPTTGNDRNATFQLVNGAALYGGFAGTETARSQRNWTANVTILSGEIGAAGYSDNSYHVATANGTDAFTILDGVTVTGGYGNGQTGGGIYVNNGSLVIANSHIADNFADYGGGLFQSGGGEQIQISTSWIERNTATNHGGGLYVNGTVQLENTQVLSNTATGHGGGLHANNGDATLIGGSFRNNRTLVGNGGGVNVNNSININGTTFISNTAAVYGGGLLQWNAGQTITMNSARFEHNKANQDGGGLWVHGNTTAANVVVVDNIANGQGSGVLLKGSVATFRHTTIARNSGGQGNGIVVINDGATYSNVTLTNMILVNQTVGVTTAAGNTTALNGVLWYGNGANTGGTGSVTVQNATTGNPAFVTDGYHLSAQSAAIDHGINAGITRDIDGDPRPMGQGYDLGADEYKFMVYLPLVLRQNP